jgi:RNA polymerase sigma-70 factor, ECF subfamily
MRAPELTRGAVHRADGALPADVSQLPDDWALAREVKRLAAGDPVAARERFGELVALHQPRAVRIAVAWLRNPADADEAVQDAFIRAFTSLDRYREDRPFSHWFTRILLNVCADRCRVRARAARHLVPLGEEGAYAGRRSDEPEHTLVSRRWRDAVADAVDELPERQRQVFMLCQYGGRLTAEVASLLGLQESTVRVHLFRAVQKLRTALEVWRETR